MNKKTISLLSLLLCLAAGFWVLLSVSKEEGTEPVSDGGLEVVQSASETTLEPLDIFDGAEPLRGVAPAVSIGAWQPEVISDVGSSSGGAPAPFTGKVVGSRGEPIEGAEVLISRNWQGMRFMATPPASEPLLTDSGGVFLVRNLPRHDLKIEVRASGYALFKEELVRQNVGISNSATGPDDLGVFTLEPGVILRGVVLDFFGAPVSGADLYVEEVKGEELNFFIMEEPRSNPDAVSSQDGSFSLESVPLGPWSIRASHDLHPTEEVAGVSERPGLHPESVRIQLPESGVITGHVKGDAETAECRVLAERSTSAQYRSGWGEINFHREAEINVDGSFELAGLLSEESYELFVTSEEGPMGFGDPLSPRVKARTGDSGVVLNMTGATGFQFRVVDASTGEPIENFRAEAGSWGMETLRGPKGRVLLHHPDGQARFENLRQLMPGVDARLKVLAEGFEAHSVILAELVRGEMFDLGEIRLKPVPYLRLTVLSEADGAPVHNARVTLSSATSRATSFGGFDDFDGAMEISSFGGEEEEVERRGRTDEDGRLSLTTIPGARCVLRVSHPQFAELSLAPAVYEGGERELRLISGGTVRVFVQQEGGGVGVGVEVSRSEGSGGYTTVVTNQNGMALFDHLAPSTHSFRIEEEESDGFPFPVEYIDGGDPHAEAAGWVSVEVSEGGEHELTLVQAARGVLYGRITEAGRALAGATLRLSSWSPDVDVSGAGMGEMMFFGSFGGGGLEKRSKGDGSYRMKEKAAGEYELLVSHSTRAMQERFRVTLTPGEVKFDVDLSLTGLAGIVLDEFGQPVPGAKVSVSKPGALDMSNDVVILGGTGGGGSFSSEGGLGGSSTNLDGSFQLKGLIAGEELELSVKKNPYQPVKQSISPLSSGELRSGLRVALERGGGVKVQMLSSDGSPVEFGSLVLTKVEVTSVPIVREGGVHNGAASFEGLAPGEWTAEATVYGFPGNGVPDTTSQEKLIVVKTGEVSEAVFQF
jgi:protocatechuate 3,4-dioxygenase beta subunit